jgi:hypothetical protein
MSSYALDETSDCKQRKASSQVVYRHDGLGLISLFRVPLAQHDVLHDTPYIELLGSPHYYFYDFRQYGELEACVVKDNLGKLCHAQEYDGEGFSCKLDEVSSSASSSDYAHHAMHHVSMRMHILYDKTFWSMMDKVGTERIEHTRRTSGWSFNPPSRGFMGLLGSQWASIRTCYAGCAPRTQQWEYSTDAI